MYGNRVESFRFGLHFELYLGLRAGQLTPRSGGAVDRVHGRSFRRRGDVVDPTALLRRAYEAR